MALENWENKIENEVLPIHNVLLGLTFNHFLLMVVAVLVTG